MTRPKKIVPSLGDGLQSPARAAGSWQGNQGRGCHVEALEAASTCRTPSSWRSWTSEQILSTVDLLRADS
jgi:hypothetical protein